MIKFDDVAYDLDTLPDEPTPYQFIMLKRSALEVLPYTRMKWQCQAKGCCNGTHVRDYGIQGWYFLDRNSKSSWGNPRSYWYFVEEHYWLCGKHNKIWSRLSKKGYTREHIAFRIGDWTKQKLIKINPAGE